MIFLRLRDGRSDNHEYYEAQNCNSPYCYRPFVHVSSLLVFVRFALRGLTENHWKRKLWFLVKQLRSVRKRNPDEIGKLSPLPSPSSPPCNPVSINSRNALAQH
nr:hypothetical protein Itr_chr14CG01920 [Ipomoea trifida]